MLYLTIHTVTKCNKIHTFSIATVKNIGSSKIAAALRPKQQFNSKYGNPSGQGNIEYPSKFLY